MAQNSFAAKLADVEAFGCGGCLADIEALGPVQGPEAPRPGAERWSMTPAEWFGMDLPDTPH